jgi:hypothetical protein
MAENAFIQGCKQSLTDKLGKTFRENQSLKNPAAEQ